MIIIHHRINSVRDLKRVQDTNGIEVDVRYHENELILEHDPYEHHNKKNTTLKDLLVRWDNSGPIILNFKSEGIEDECINIMEEYEVNNWFFLDMSMPFLVKYSDLAHKRIPRRFSPNNLAVRFSDREPIEYALAFKDKVKWVWVDYFDNFPLNKKTFLSFKSASFKICLVSPELQNKPCLNHIQLAKICSDFDIDAICTKKPEFWLNINF